jgi:LacI family transcriptional regulator
MTDQPVTLKDVAAMAGVHPATVSRALNPETRLLVSDETADRILAAADALGYRPNTVARSLRTRRSNTIGVLLPDLTNPLFPPIVRGLEDRLASAGYVALIGNTDSDDERERLVFELMRDRHVDGFVFATAQLRSSLLAEASAAGIPVVLVNRAAEGYGFPSVSVDNERGIGMSVDHLASLGHRKIAHIAGPQGISTGLSRYRGYVAAMAAHGLQVDDGLVVTASGYTIDEGERCCRLLLEANTGCTAIAAANDMLAMGCYAAIEQAGLSCPKDISVVGFNDMPFIDRLTPPLTSVSFAHYEVGREAGRLILEQIASGSATAGVHHLAPELKVRGSTAAPAAVPATLTDQSA